MDVFIRVSRRERVLALFFCDISVYESSSKFHKYCKKSEQKPRNGRVNIEVVELELSGLIINQKKIHNEETIIWWI